MSEYRAWPDSKSSDRERGPIDKDSESKGMRDSSDLVAGCTCEVWREPLLQLKYWLFFLAIFFGGGMLVLRCL